MGPGLADECSHGIVDLNAELARWGDGDSQGSIRTRRSRVKRKKVVENRKEERKRFSRSSRSLNKGISAIPSEKRGDGTFLNARRSDEIQGNQSPSYSGIQT
mmetsp:Transcript_19967/g.35931  ORF Transcript_19967/g.35931 Transcript_19967/m.35931 type:complete len:102 (-) Transcript_19967:506-811(-)